MVRLLLISSFVTVLAAIGAADWLDGLSASRQAAPSPAAAVATATPASQPPPAPDLGPGEAAIAKSADGQFWADAMVDGHPLRVLIDTGASDVSLTEDDARSLGIDTGALTYAYTMQTANGPARAAEVKLDLVSVGRAEVADVRAFVVERGLDTSLLGMSYLGRLSKFEATRDALLLRS